MLRITQSYVINQTSIKLEEMGFKVIYKDLPHGNRSGVGIKASLNLMFEHLFDKSPDIVAISPDKDILIVEVDHSFKKGLPQKFEVYYLNRDKLIKDISKIYGAQLNKIIFGFAITKKSCPKININNYPFYVFYLNNNSNMEYVVYDN